MAEKQDNPIQDFVSFLHAHPRIDGHQQNGKLKLEYEKFGRAALKTLGQFLYLPKARVVYDGAGHEVAGTLTLKEMYTPDKGVFVQFSQDGPANTFVFRKLRIKGDKIGEENHFASIDQLLEPEQLATRMLAVVGINPNKPLHEQTVFHQEFIKGERAYHTGIRKFGVIVETEYSYLSTNMGRVGHQLKTDEGKLRWGVQSFFQKVDEDGKIIEGFPQQFPPNPSLRLGEIRVETDQSRPDRLAVHDIVEFDKPPSREHGYITEIDQQNQTASLSCSLCSENAIPLSDLRLILPASGQKDRAGITFEELDELKKSGYLRWPIEGIKQNLHSLLMLVPGNEGRHIGEALMNQFLDERNAFYQIENQLLILYAEPSPADLLHMNYIGRLILAGEESTKKGIASAFRDARYRVVHRYGKGRWPLLPQFKRGDVVWLPKQKEFALVLINLEKWIDDRPLFAYQVVHSTSETFVVFDDAVQPGESRIDWDKRRSAFDELRSRFLVDPELDINHTMALEVFHQRWNRHLLFRALARDRNQPHIHEVQDNGLEISKFHFADFAAARSILQATKQQGAILRVKAIFRPDEEMITPPFTNPYISFPETPQSMPKNEPYENLKPNFRFSIIQLIDRSEIQVKPDLFQGRQDAFAQETVEKIVREGYDQNREPIILWRDEDENAIVLSGHSRWEASERLYKDGDSSLKMMPVRFFEGSLQEAMDFALLESNRGVTQESLHSDLAAYKRALQRGYNRDYLKGLFKPESRLRLFEDLAQLNEKGSLLQYLGTSSESSFPYLQRNAQWIGGIRKAEPRLTNAHEEELFNYLYPTDSSGKASGKRRITISKDQFFQTINRKIQRLDFDPELALNLNEVVSTSAVTEPHRERIEELNQEITQLNKKREKTDKSIAQARRERNNTLVEQFQKRLDDISAQIQLKLEEKEKLETAIGKLEKETIDLFHQEEMPDQKTTTSPKEEPTNNPNPIKMDEIKSPAELLKEAGLKASEVSNVTEFDAFYKRVEAVEKMAGKAGENPVLELRQTMLRYEISAIVEVLISKFLAGGSNRANVKKEVTEQLLESIDGKLKELEECDSVSKALRSKRRDVIGGDKPKTVLTRIQKLTKELLDIVKLIPEELRDDLEVQSKSEEILLNTLNQLKDIWKLNKIKAAEKDIRGHFDEKESKTRSKNRMYGDGSKQYKATLEVPGSTTKIPEIIILANSKKHANEQYKDGLGLHIKGVNTKKGDLEFNKALPKEAQNAKIAALEVVTT